MRASGAVRGAIAVALSAAAVLAAGPAEAGGGCHDPAATTAWGTTVDMKGACFLPTVVRVGPGTSVTWENVDAMAHVVMGLGWGAPDELAPGQSVTYRFDRPGIYPYTCFYHPGMVGAVVVGRPGGAAAGGTGEVRPVPGTAGTGEVRAVPAAGSGGPAVAAPPRSGEAGSEGSRGPWPVVGVGALALLVGAASGPVVRRAARRGRPGGAA